MILYTNWPKCSFYQLQSVEFMVGFRTRKKMVYAQLSDDDITTFCMFVNSSTNKLYNLIIECLDVLQKFSNICDQTSKIFT